jgi:hypothetical protein
MAAQTFRFLQLHPRIEHWRVVVITPHRRFNLGPVLPLRCFLAQVHWLSLDVLGEQDSLDARLQRARRSAGLVRQPSGGLSLTPSGGPGADNDPRALPLPPALRFPISWIGPWGLQAAGRCARAGGAVAARQPGQRQPSQRHPGQWREPDLGAISLSGGLPKKSGRLRRHRRRAANSRNNQQPGPSQQPGPRAQGLKNQEGNLGGGSRRGTQRRRCRGGWPGGSCPGRPSGSCGAR